MHIRSRLRAGESHGAGFTHLIPAGCVHALQAFGRTDHLIVRIVFVLSIIWSLWSLTRGWDNSLSDIRSGFRQTQTALTSYYLQQPHHSLFNYETPVVGAPWSIPFEFPLYQWLVVQVARTGLPLAQSGRLVSVWFFAAALLALWGILRELRIDAGDRCVFLSLMLVSPRYIITSRDFMIESTALFFCMAYLFLVLRSARTKSVLVCLGGACLCGTLGALVKVTTFAGFLAAAVLLYGYLRWIDRNSEPAPGWSRRLMVSYALLALFCAAVPVGIAAAWTRHADSLKALNVVGAGLTSASLHDWNFGVLSQKLSLSGWGALLERTFRDMLGHAAIAVGLLGVGVMLAPVRWKAVACMTLFLLPPLIFTNLHFVHGYYPYANGVFLIAACAWGIVGLSKCNRLCRLCAALLLTMTVVASGYRYYRAYYGWIAANHLYAPGLIQAIQANTAPEDVVVVFADTWSSEIPYYSERRALMWKERPPSFTSPELRTALANLSSYRIGALVIFQKINADRRFVDEAITRFGLARDPAFADDDYRLYVRSGAGG